jgi:hypothetical protein
MNTNLINFPGGKLQLNLATSQLKSITKIPETSNFFLTDDETRKFKKYHELLKNRDDVRRGKSPPAKSAFDKLILEKLTENKL